MSPSPPGPLIQAINAVLHTEPLATVMHVTVFLMTLTLGFPLAVISLLLHGLIRWGRFTSPPLTPTKCHGVVITGCDSGFGRELALTAADAGYTVFAGCLDPKNAWPGALPSGLLPIQMDVTKQSDVDSTVRSVEEWLAAKDGNILHALVNNAGVGRLGLIDWLNMESFEHCMNVNYFGLVRTCKSFLPIFKRQVNSDCRIINITSMAGRVNGNQAASAYMASKHAANAFSHVLRAECRSYVQVSTINPTFHATPLVTTIESEAKKVWDNLDSQKQEEYGEGNETFIEHIRLTVSIRQDYFRSISQYCFERPMYFAWDMSVVVDQLEILLKCKHLPPEVFIGSDARFIFAPMLAMPLWLTEQMIRISMIGLRVPAFLKKT